MFIDGLVIKAKRFPVYAKMRIIVIQDQTWTRIFLYSYLGGKLSVPSDKTLRMVKPISLFQLVDPL